LLRHADPQKTPFLLLPFEDGCLAATAVYRLARGNATVLNDISCLLVVAQHRVFESFTIHYLEQMSQYMYEKWSYAKERACMANTYLKWVYAVT
jgi:hypothetical protein